MITSLPLAAAALLVTGTLCLVLASGSWETGAATAVERSGRLAGVEVRDQATVELQVSFVLLLRLYSAHRCAAGPHVAAISEQCVRECVDRVRSINGDEKLTSRF